MLLNVGAQSVALNRRLIERLYGALPFQLPDLYRQSVLENRAKYADQPLC
jgi:hypothetical protein